MSEIIIRDSAIFRPLPGHTPRSQQERYQRVHHYVSELGAAASIQLKQALLAVRNNAAQMPPDLQPLASKQYLESEFLPATKELLAIWIHLEAVDQGGPGAPTWLIHYLKLALLASDYLIANPAALNIMQQHADCRTLSALKTEVAITISTYLGYGERAMDFAPVFKPLLHDTRVVRQNILKESLTGLIEDWLG